MSQINYQAIFDGNDLTTVLGLTVLSTDPYKLPKRKLTIYNIVRTNKSKTASGFFEKRIITVRVGISRTTRDQVEQSLDALAVMLQGLEKELVLKQSGGQRKYFCSLADTVMAEDGGSYIEMNLVFECSDRFGYDLANTLLLQITGATATPRTDTVTVGGSAQWQVPIITYTITALTGGTAKNVVIGNQTTGQIITITRTWAAGDLIEVDCLNRTVKVNGADITFTGAFPDVSPGSAVLSYSDTLTTRTLSGSVNYKKRYL